MSEYAKSAIGANGSGRRPTGPRWALAAVAGLLVGSCGSSGSDPLATPEPVSSGVPSGVTAATSTSTTVVPHEAVTPRDPPCRQRDPREFTDREFPYDPPAPDGPGPLAEAELVRYRGSSGVDARSLETGIVIDSGWSFPNEGVPSLFRVLASDDPDAEVLFGAENCRLRDDFVISGPYLIAGLGNPSGWVVVDLRDSHLVGDVEHPSGPILASTHPSRPAGAWIQDVQTGSASVVRRFDVESMSLGPPLYDVDDSAGATFPSVFETVHGLLVALEAQVWLLDPDTGEQLAGWLPPAETPVRLIGGDDDRVWLRLGADVLVALDPATLEMIAQARIAHLVHASHGYGRIWYSTLDDHTSVVTIGHVDPTTGEIVERAAFETYVQRGRGGPSLFSPYPVPLEGGVRFFDERSGASYELTVD